MIHLTKIRHKTSKNDTKREKENTEMPKLTQNPRKKSKSCAYSGFFSYTYEPRLQLLMHPLNHPVGLRGRGVCGRWEWRTPSLPIWAWSGRSWSRQPTTPCLRHRPLEHVAYGEVSVRVLKLGSSGQGRLCDIKGLFHRLRPKQTLKRIGEGKQEPCTWPGTDHIPEAETWWLKNLTSSWPKTDWQKSPQVSAQCVRQRTKVNCSAEQCPLPLSSQTQPLQ